MVVSIGIHLGEVFFSLVVGLVSAVDLSFMVVASLGVLTFQGVVLPGFGVVEVVVEKSKVGQNVLDVVPDGFRHSVRT